MHKGLPVLVRIVLLDTRFIHYQHVYIEAAQTTLNIGIVIMTLFQISIKAKFSLPSAEIKLPQRKISCGPNEKAQVGEPKWVVGIRGE